MFAGLTGLTHLDLGSNRLTTVPDDMFDELTALKVLSLDFNIWPRWTPGCSTS